jgi:hypothetical protein
MGILRGGYRWCALYITTQYRLLQRTLDFGLQLLHHCQDPMMYHLNQHSIPRLVIQKPCDACMRNIGYLINTKNCPKPSLWIMKCGTSSWSSPIHVEITVITRSMKIQQVMQKQRWWKSFLTGRASNITDSECAVFNKYMCKGGACVLYLLHISSSNLLSMVLSHFSPVWHQLKGCNCKKPAVVEVTSETSVEGSSYWHQKCFEWLRMLTCVATVSLAVMCIPLMQIGYSVTKRWTLSV